CLRTIDKKGGLDNYLLTTSDENLASFWGSSMKRVLRAKVQEKLENQAVEAKGAQKASTDN
ncbi:hypothetical protein L0F63_005343, partial [Massospora cicadina]